MYKLLKLIAVIVASLAIVFGLGLFQFTHDLENATIDLREIAFAPKTGASERIVMVWLDEKTMEKLPYRSPVPRDFLAELNNKLSQAGTMAIGYDIYFKDPSFSSEDRSFARSLAQSNAYAVMPLRSSENFKIEGEVDPPLEMFARALKGIGLADLPIAAFDTKVRSARLYYDTDEGVTPTFAALLYDAATGSNAGEAVKAGWHWPKLGLIKFTPFFGDQDTVLIRFAGPPSKLGSSHNKFKIFPANLVVEGVIPLKWFKDKIVLVGAAYSDLMDAYPTPYYGRHTDFARMNGVEIHASILNQLLTGQFYYGPERWMKLLLVLFIVLISASSAVFLSPLRAAPTTVGLFAFIIIASAYSFRTAGIVIPVVIPLFALILSFGLGVAMRAFAEGRQRKFIKQVFARYVPKAVVERISNNPKLAELGGEERIVTSLFTDIASFTSISENIPPTEVVSFLNDYLEHMNRIILGYGGTIDKYEGDAVIAFFNAPLDVEAHETMALFAAVEIEEATRKVGERWKDTLGHELVTRVGIHTGHAVVGNLGSEGRFDYTAIGDTINLASRMEGANKFYGTRVLATDETIRVGSKDIVSRQVDLVRVKGRDKPVIIHEVVGTVGKIDAKLMNGLIKPYRKAYELYSSRDPGKASVLFSEISKKYPTDGPTLNMLDRCHYAKDNPDWDLVTDLTAK